MLIYYFIIEEINFIKEEINFIKKEINFIKEETKFINKLKLIDNYEFLLYYN